MCLRRFLTSCCGCSEVLLWQDSPALCRIYSLVLSTGKLAAQPWHHVFLQPAAPAPCPGFWWRRTICSSGNANLSQTVHTVTNTWEGETSCRAWTCAMWFESQMKEIKLELGAPAPFPAPPGLNHARRSWGEFQNWDTLSCSSINPKIIPPHQLHNSTADTCAWKEKLWLLPGIIDRFIGRVGGLHCSSPKVSWPFSLDHRFFGVFRWGATAMIQVWCWEACQCLCMPTGSGIINSGR